MAVSLGVMTSAHRFRQVCLSVSLSQLFRFRFFLCTYQVETIKKVNMREKRHNLYQFWHIPRTLSRNMTTVVHHRPNGIIYKLNYE